MSDACEATARGDMQRARTSRFFGTALSYSTFMATGVPCHVPEHTRPNWPRPISRFTFSFWALISHSLAVEASSSAGNEVDGFIARSSWMV